MRDRKWARMRVYRHREKVATPASSQDEKMAKVNLIAARGTWTGPCRCRRQRLDYMFDRETGQHRRRGKAGHARAANECAISPVADPAPRHQMGPEGPVGPVTLVLIAQPAENGLRRAPRLNDGDDGL